MKESPNHDKLKANEWNYRFKNIQGPSLLGFYKKKSSLKCWNIATNSRGHYALRYSSEQEILIKCFKKKKATINSVCIIINMTLPSVPAPQPYNG